jgi:hypothetical protein
MGPLLIGGRHTFELTDRVDALAILTARTIIFKLGAAFSSWGVLGWKFAQRFLVCA